MLLKNKTQQGFTLIELMVIIAIVGIISATAVQSYASTMQRAALKGLSDEISTSLTRARIAAMTGGNRVAICPVPDITAIAVNDTCNTTWATLAPNTADGRMGWMVFKDDDQDGILNNMNELITRFSFDDRKKVGINPATTNCQPAIRFTRKGLLASGGCTIRLQSGSPSYQRNTFIRSIVIAANTGRITNRLGN